MKNKQLDKILKEKLERIRPPLQPGSWDQFELRLNERESGVPEPRDKAVDEMLFNRLHQLEVPYRSATWPTMEERLDREFVRPEVVLRYKGAEVLLLLLLLLPLWQYLPLNSGNSSIPVANAVPANTAGDRDPSAAQESKAVPAITPVVKESQAAGDTPGAVAAETGSTVAVMPRDGETSVGQPAASFDRTHSMALLPALQPLQNGFPISAARSSILTQPFLLSATDKRPPARLGVLTTLDAQSPAGVLAAGVRQSFQLQPTHKNRYLYFSMFGSMDYNRIMTPSERFFDVETHAFDRYALGYSGGFSLGFEWGRWELQSGAIYSAKRYRPLQLQIRIGNSRDGYSTEQLKDITLNILHIPLNLRYNLFRHDRWRLYTLAGASMQILPKPIISSTPTAPAGVPYSPNTSKTAGWKEVPSGKTPTCRPTSASVSSAS